MIKFHPRLLILFRAQSSKCLTSLPSSPTFIQPNGFSNTQHQTQIEINFNANSAHISAQLIATHLSNCTSLHTLNQIHTKIIRTSGVKLRENAFFWNNIIRSYVKFDSPSLALGVYLLMARNNVHPDFYTIPIVLKAVCQVFDVVVGVQVHCIALKLGLDLFEFCESGFINIYAKAGDFGNARKVFEQSPERKLGSWNAIIWGLTHAGHAKEAISMFMELLKSGLEPDDVTMVGVTSACGSLGDLNLGLQLHKCVFQAKRFEKSDMLMLNSLIDMYGKCGRMELAYKVFVGMVERSVLTWTSLIMGFAMHGHVRDALECFRCMREAGVRPNYVTFVGVLSACVHGGLVQEGRHYFNMMIDEYGIMPKLPHYGVMVDLLGRAGLLEEAKDMVENMPMEANVIIWGALMGACEKHGSVEMAEWVAKHLEELEPWNDGVYVVLSNVYAGAGMWEEVERIRMIMKGRSVAKTPAYSATTV